MSVVPGDVFACRFGVVTIEVVEPDDGQLMVRGAVHGRDLHVGFAAAELPEISRPPVSTEQAESAWGLMQTQGEPDSEPLESRFDHYQNVTLGFDFDEKVTHLRYLHALDSSSPPARAVLALELQRALVSEIAYVLGGNFGEMMAELRSMLR